MKYILIDREIKNQLLHTYIFNSSQISSNVLLKG